jgi:hypothetical protein
MSGDVGTVPSRIDVHCTPITTAQRKKQRFRLTKCVRDAKFCAARSRAVASRQRAMRNHACSEHAAREICDSPKIHMLSGFLTHRRNAAGAPLSMTETRTTGKMRSKCEAMRRFYPRGKNLADITCQGAVGSRNRSKTSESVAGDSRHAPASPLTSERHASTSRTS